MPQKGFVTPFVTVAPGGTEGGVALWIGAGTEGFFSNVKISKR